MAKHSQINIRKPLKRYIREQLTAGIYALQWAITTQGSHTTPSVVTCTIIDPDGRLLTTPKQFNLRIRVANAAGYANATNATIAVTGASGTTLLASNTATKDLDVQSNTSGVISITATDATAETFLLLAGNPLFGGVKMDCSSSQSVTHA